MSPYQLNNSDFTHHLEKLQVFVGGTIKDNILTIDLQPYEQERIFMISCWKDEDNKYDIKGAWKKCKINPQLYHQVITIANNKLFLVYSLLNIIYIANSQIL